MKYPKNPYLKETEASRAIDRVRKSMRDPTLPANYEEQQRILEWLGERRGMEASGQRQAGLGDALNAAKASEWVGYWP